MLFQLIDLGHTWPTSDTCWNINGPTRNSLLPLVRSLVRCEQRVTAVGVSITVYVTYPKKVTQKFQKDVTAASAAQHVIKKSENIENRICMYTFIERQRSGAERHCLHRLVGIWVY